MNVTLDMNFTHYDADRYTKKNECPRCKGLLSSSLMEGCSMSMEVSCACGFKKYLFFREEADTSMKSIVTKPKGPTKFKTMPCMCHKVLGGPPCNVTFQTKAGNALYCPQHSKKAKIQVGINARIEKIKTKGI